MRLCLCIDLSYKYQANSFILSTGKKKVLKAIFLELENYETRIIYFTDIPIASI